MAIMKDATWIALMSNGSDWFFEIGLDLGVGVLDCDFGKGIGLGEFSISSNNDAGVLGKGFFFIIEQIYNKRPQNVLFLIHLKEWRQSSA